MKSSVNISCEYDVLHVIPYMHPRAGGPPVVVDRLCRQLFGLGWRSRVVSTDSYAPADDRTWQHQYDEAYPLDVFPCGRPGSFSFSSQLAESIDDLVRRSRLVHLHTLWTHSSLVATRACRRHNVPYVIMPHGMLDPNSLRRGWLKKQIYGRLIEWPGVRRARGMVYTHPLERQLANSAVAGLPQGYIVPLGTDEPPPTPRAELAHEFLNEFPALRGRKLVTFLSRLHPKKGLDLLISGFRLLRQRHGNAHLVLVGPGEASYLDHLRHLVEQAGLTEKVTFTGPLEGRRKWAALAAASVFALPSYQENFGLVIVEAQRMGLPVIISRCVNIWQEIVDGGGGVVADLTPLGVATALEPLLQDPALAEEMGRRGQEFVQARFSWQIAAETLAGVYRVVLEQKNHAPPAGGIGQS